MLAHRCLTPLQPVTERLNLPSACLTSHDPLAEPVAQHMEACRRNLLALVGRRHPLLRAAADQIFSAGGKRLRPLIVLLVSSAALRTVGLAELSERHLRLAEITEMMHTASLVHDDVLDDCGLRRGRPTVHSLFGTRVAVLVGDYLFAQSSRLLAELGELEIIRLISQVIADFADGEVGQAAALFDTQVSLEEYMHRSFYKTASLMAATARAATVLTGCPDHVRDAMYDYGRCLGLAFQIVDDVHDYTQDARTLGKPPGQDLAAGNLTAPVVFALQDPELGPELRDLIESRFREPDALERALGLVARSGGIQRSLELARRQGDAALAALVCLPPSPAKRSLESLVEFVLQRIY